MKEDINKLAAFYNRIHPALHSKNILFWHQIKKTKFDRPILLYGNPVSCELLIQRLNTCGIHPTGVILSEGTALNIKEIPVLVDNEIKDRIGKSILLVTLQDYPGTVENYLSVEKQLKKLGCEKPYVIHEFSSGFALGAENLVDQQHYVEQAYDLLKDKTSRSCYLAFLEHINRPYHWNMDIRSENFGIPDNKRYEQSGEWEFEPIPFINLKESLLLHSCTTDWNKNDPFIRLSKFAQKAVFLNPHDLYRMKLRELLSREMLDTVKNTAVLNNILWEQSGLIQIEKEQYAGGTPLSYSVQTITINALTVDDLMRQMPTEKLGLIVLDMNSDYMKAIHGATITIEKDNPTIAVCGFKSAEKLWKSIVHLYESFPTWSIKLRRYPCENVIMGHIIYLERENT